MHALKIITKYFQSMLYEETRWYDKKYTVLHI